MKIDKTNIQEIFFIFISNWLCSKDSFESITHALKLTQTITKTTVMKQNLYLGESGSQMPHGDVILGLWKPLEGGTR